MSDASPVFKDLEEHILSELDRYGSKWIPLALLAEQIFGYGHSQSEHAQVAAAVRKLSRKGKLQKVKRPLVVVRSSEGG